MYIFFVSQIGEMVHRYISLGEYEEWEGGVPLGGMGEGLNTLSVAPVIRADHGEPQYANISVAVSDSIYFMILYYFDICILLFYSILILILYYFILFCY